MARMLGSRHCVVCGSENPVGMHLRFRVSDGTAETAWIPAPHFQGFEGVLHGGAVLALCDDAMWYAVFGGGACTMTAEAVVRYRAPVRIGVPLAVRGWVAERRGRLWQCAAELAEAEGGSVLATASGKFLTLPAEQAALLARVGVHEYPDAAVQ